MSKSKKHGNEPHDWDYEGSVDHEFTETELQALFKQIDEKDEMADSAKLYNRETGSEGVPVKSKTVYQAPITTVTHCNHVMDEVLLVDGAVYASASRDAPKGKRKSHETPDLGIYFYSGWMTHGDIQTSPGLVLPFETTDEPEGWPWVYLDWPDYGVPYDFDLLCKVVTWTLEQVAADVIVETGCMGGHGRTGSFLACLLVAQDTDPGEAIRYVRDVYCDKAVETEKQVDLVAKVYEKLTGDKDWRKDKSKRKSFHKQRKLVEKPKWSGTSSYGGSTSWSNDDTKAWGAWVPGWTDSSGTYIPGHYQNDVFFHGRWMEPGKTLKVWSAELKTWEIVTAPAKSSAGAPVESKDLDRGKGVTKK